MLELCNARYGNRFTLQVTGFPPLVFLSDPHEIRTMLRTSTSALHPGKGAAMIKPIVGDGSFMLHDDQQHRIERQAVLPAFHKETIQKHHELVTQLVRHEVLTWPLNASIALYPYLRAMALKLILRITFGFSQVDVNEPLDKLHGRVLKMLSVTASPVFPEPLLRHGPGWATWNRFLHDREAVDELIYTLLAERDGTTLESSHILRGLRRIHGLSATPLSHQKMRDNLMSIILAGHETTASQLAWAFQLLAHNPRVLARLISEIDRGESEEYLTATIQETLRHRPVFLFTIPRAVVKPVEIGAWRYEPPVRLLGCIYLLHHDPRIYPEPHTFRPERFLDRSPPPHLWLPWGGGRRRCPGLHMAMLEMKTALRTVLSAVTLMPAAKHMERPRWRSVIVTPHAGARVILHRRIGPTSC